ncbi:MAG: tagatose 1,6-diphosphate aldolase [Thermotogae bacterium]|nr:tagatose 1,6-diphosphate aldolase [Thermotogota bacterium]
MISMSAGKFRGLCRISDDRGRFLMLALDQRNSLRKMLRERWGKEDDEMIKMVKRSILKVLSPRVSAVLVDPEYAYPHLANYIDPRTGVILSVEKSGYFEDEKFPNERRNELLYDGIVEDAKRWGCDAVKLLIYWNDEVSENTMEHQKELVRMVGGSADSKDIVFILEILTYGPRKGEAELILSALREFSKDEYHVDLFKIEPLKNTTKEKVETAVSGKPWVILSGGVDIDIFEKKLIQNVELGSSGVLAGRVVWKKIIDYSDTELMELHLEKTGVGIVERMGRIVEIGQSWYECGSFGGFENILIVSE